MSIQPMPYPNSEPAELETWHHVESSLWTCGCRVDRSGTQCEAHVRGAIDAVSAGTLAGRLAGLVAAGVSSIDLDLERVILFDVAGARILANTARVLETTGGRLRVRHPSIAVRHVLEATGLARLVLPEP
jgi:anti-anti-sigma factor